MIHVLFLYKFYVPNICMSCLILFFLFVFFQEDLLIHGDSVYDIIDKADHGTVQTELLRNSPGTGNGGGNSTSLPGEESRLFLCRMNVSRNARRQMRFGDQKVYNTYSTKKKSFEFN
jgi:hypothetical protein